MHFELPADDPDRAVGFYSDVFGWRVEGWQGGIEYYLATTGPEGAPGINGAILRREAPATRLVVTIQVDSLNETLQKVTEVGGAVIGSRLRCPAWAGTPTARTPRAT